MFIKDGVYRDVDISGLTAPILEGTVLTATGAIAAADGSDAFGIVPENIFVMPPTKMTRVAIGGTIDLQDPANSDVVFSEDIINALGADINFVPAAEASQTVQDGSITEAKFSDALKIKTIKDYVTPQMYGAKGDGTADDTSAIQAAIDSGKPVLLPYGTYITTEPIVIENRDNIILDATASTIRYTGNSSAFIIRHLQTSEIRLGELRTPSGRGIVFDSTIAANWTQYVNISARLMVCNSDCIYASIDNQSWVNQINITNSRLASNANGVYIHHNCTNPCDNWNLTNVGFESVVNGIVFENTMLQTYGYIHGMTIIGCRYQESMTKLIKSRGYVYDITFIGSDSFTSSLLDLDTHANNWTIYAPISGNEYNKAYIINGVMVDELAIKTSAITPSSAFTQVGTNAIDKFGKVCELRVDGKYKVSSGYVPIGTLPSGFIPKRNVVIARPINIGGTIAYLRINTNSNVEIYCPSATADAVVEFYLYESYIAN